jgi:hypothetical protein
MMILERLEQATVVVVVVVGGRHELRDTVDSRNLGQMNVESTGTTTTVMIQQERYLSLVKKALQATI